MEMDALGMNLQTLLADLDVASWPTASVALAVGTLAGVAYFRSVWWSARLLVSGRRGAGLAVAMAAGRLAAIAAVFWLAARWGALALLAAAAGVLLGRALELHRARRMRT